jgi:hypothetical protein
MLAVVSRLCGLHAQLLSSAELTAWARVEGLDRDAVRRALWDERTLVKTWAMRGNLHLLPADELPLWHGALATTRRYLREALWKKHFGPSAGVKVRFTRPDTWVREAAPALDPAAATAAVTRRFLEAYGPATFHDLARWCGGTVGVARAWLGALGADVVAVDVEGAPAWVLAMHARALRTVDPVRSARLLPAFDQYVIGASFHAERLLPGPLRARVYRPQGWVSPVVLVDGLMAGVWRHAFKGSRLEVVVEPFHTLPDWARRGVALEAERLAQFYGSGLALTWKR